MATTRLEKPHCDAPACIFSKGLPLPLLFDVPCVGLALAEEEDAPWACVGAGAEVSGAWLGDAAAEDGALVAVDSLSRVEVDPLPPPCVVLCSLVSVERSTFRVVSDGDAAVAVAQA